MLSTAGCTSAGVRDDTVYANIQVSNVTIADDAVVLFSGVAQNGTCDMPANAEFQVKPDLARDVTTALVCAGTLPIRWVVLDDEYGRSAAIGDRLVAIGLCYIAPVPLPVLAWPETGELQGGAMGRDERSVRRRGRHTTAPERACRGSAGLRVASGC
jgi:hypothetical protein